ncbi:hypothetical protein WA026_000647 [Henosepilachna vigintioctopunctata]|uniref:RRM domain-containing protein n=1 Tax=Henosepilachna vigintioctopunctata TaxID=420089 RepID=A0AAW1V5T7_9CUCU
MDNFPFRYPPPPPLPVYSPNPPPPPPPITTTCIVRQPPLPPQTTKASWGNFDFSRPPPPLVNSIRNTSTNGINIGHGSRISSPSLSPGSNQDSSSYYGFSNDTSHLYMTNNRQYPARRYRQDQHTNNKQPNRALKNNFKKPRTDSQVDQRSDYSDRSYYGTCEVRYPRSTPILDTRSTYTRSTTSVDSNSSSNDTKYQEEVTQRRKRKKPLSMAVPSKKGWTYEEADMALDTEKEFNKLFKNHSLKIKFPDQELNREIVSKFHPSVETVYFQQPSSPRFCFVTLVDGADPNAVIEELNKIKFGLGYLSAEYKKDREEEQIVGREDIDPLTLYVGNLAPEVTREDMENFFPKNKRIDIGFAKKMRFTRYAFVSFNTVQDSIEAFKATHYADMHSKSMIVRFRRLHGTVGMPGEPKVQHPSRQTQDETRRVESSSVNSDQLSTSISEPGRNVDSDDIRFSSPGQSPKDSPFDSDRRTISECSDSSTFDPNLVKNEPYEYPNDDFDSYHSENDVEQSEPGQQHITSQQNEELESQNLPSTAIVKKEPEYIAPTESTFPVIPMSLKQEPRDDEDSCCESSASQQNNVDASTLINGYKEPKKEIENCEPNPEDNEEEFNTTTDFGSVLDNLKKRQTFIP